MKFLLVVIVFAVATYFLVRLLQERGLTQRPERPGGPGRPGGGPGGLPGRPRRPRPSGPPPVRGPDDDEDFLRNLDKERREQRRRAERDDPEA